MLSDINSTDLNYEFVENQDGLSRLIERVNKIKVAAFDLEFIPEKTYFPELCLIQCCVGGETFLVDPYKLSNAELNIIWQVICDPAIKCLFHCAEQDLEIVARLSGGTPSNIFDTQIAAAFAGLGFSVGLKKLVMEMLGVQLTKAECFSNWSQRPLTREQIRYAIADVEHLELLCQKLSAKLDLMGRYEWAKEEFETCSSKAANTNYRRNLDICRVKGANRLDRKELAILQELLNWRDEEAQRLNKPLRSILSDQGLLEVSTRRASDPKLLKNLRGIRDDQLKRYETQIVNACQKGLSLPSAQWPTWPEARPPSKKQLLVGDFLYVILKQISVSINLPVEYIANRDELQHLIRCFQEGNLQVKQNPGAKRPRLLEGWRYELVGKKLLHILEGNEVKAGVIPDPEEKNELVMSLEMLDRSEK